MSLRSYSLIGALAVALIACGASKPGPLQHHFDDMYIARVPIDEKRSVLDAQQEWSIAKMELAAARQVFDESVTDVKIAQNEAKKYKLEKQSIKERIKIAEKTGDMTMLNESTLLASAADLQYKAAKKKVKYLQAHRKYLLFKIDYQEALMFEQEARYEMSKARMAQSHNIQPKGFVPARYQKQQEQRARYSQQTKTRVAKARAKAERIKKEWNGLEKAAQAAENKAYNAGPPPVNNGGFPPASPAPAPAPTNQTPFEPLPPLSGGTQ